MLSSKLVLLAALAAAAVLVAAADTVEVHVNGQVRQIDASLLDELFPHRTPALETVPYDSATPSFESEARFREAQKAARQSSRLARGTRKPTGDENAVDNDKHVKAAKKPATTLEKSKHTRFIHKPATMAVRKGHKNVKKQVSQHVDTEGNSFDLKSVMRECPPSPCRKANRCPVMGGHCCGKEGKACCPPGHSCLTTVPPTCVDDRNLNDMFRCAEVKCEAELNCPHKGVMSCCTGGDSCCPLGFHCTGGVPSGCRKLATDEEWKEQMRQQALIAKVWCTCWEEMSPDGCEKKAHLGKKERRQKAIKAHKMKLKRREKAEAALQHKRHASHLQDLQAIKHPNKPRKEVQND